MKQIQINDLDWAKMGDLIPVITQEVNTKQVLTLAYVNKKALKKTIETGWAHYFRRSYKKVMKKGITSGNVQKIHSIFVDCDNDSILYLVDQTGIACHLGETTCFHKLLTNDEQIG
jgi:phosphoribosyl-AMP cyclohydrolase